MRQMSTVLLSALTVCALGQATNAQVPGQTPAPQTPPSKPQAPDPDVPPPVPTDTTPPANPPDRRTTPSVNGPTPASPSDDNPQPPAGSPAPVNPDGSNATNPDGSGPSGPSPDASAVPPPPPPGAAPSASATVDIRPSTSPELLEYDPYGYGWYEPGLMSGVGVSAVLGGGVTGFTDRTMRNTTSDLGGMWDLKITIGSHVPLALELGYMGSATNINGLPTGQKGTLIGTTAEAALRYNILPHYAWTPYVFGGVGWQRYDVTQATVSLSDGGMNDHDNLLEFPVGSGLAYRMQGFVFDLRGTFRATTDNNLVLTTPTLNPSSNNFAKMNSWEASAAIGYEF